MQTTLSWHTDSTPSALHDSLRLLGEAYPIIEGGSKGVKVTFRTSNQPGQCRVTRKGNSAEIIYSTSAQALRGVGALLGGARDLDETTCFTSLGIMLDCSRNAVITLDHVKVWMQRLALLGYNRVMLYTEDTYELPGEPYFGYQRGRYSEEELRAMDAFAARLGIEVIACIQTLGHLERILRHPVYKDIRDTYGVLMTGEPKTYQLIDKMISFWKGILRTDRIHIGMDESVDIGRGSYLTKNGYRPGFELMNEHLAHVVEACTRQGLKPMIWSDMYFSLGAPSHEYYDVNTVIPREVVEGIPRDVELVYWDYYHHDKAFYLDWIQRHRDMGKEPLMASGIWTWNRYWYDHAKTVNTAGPCVDACLESGVKEIFFTQWGDNGAYCDHDSAFAGMTWCAERAYGHATPDATNLENRFGAICGGSYQTHILAAELHAGPDNNFQPNMWEDPIFETHFRTHYTDDTAGMAASAARIDSIAQKLQPSSRKPGAGNLVYAYATARAFADRYKLISDLLAAYRQGDKAALKTAAEGIPPVRKSIAKMADAFRTMWMSHNKPEGIELIQARFGTLEYRYRELSLRLEECLAGKVRSIPEWDAPCPPGKA